MTASLPPNLGRELVAFVRARGIGQLKHFDRGRLLHWQGDPVDTVDIVVDGVVKLSSVSIDGRVRTSRLLGRGGVLGAEELLLSRGYETVAEAAEDAEVVVIAADEYRALVTTDHELALLVMRRLALDVHTLSGKSRTWLCWTYGSASRRSSSSWRRCTASRQSGGSGSTSRSPTRKSARWSPPTARPSRLASASSGARATCGRKAAACS